MMVNNTPIVANHRKDNLYKMNTPSLKHTGKCTENGLPKNEIQITKIQI